jgi:hypothetical protein
MARKEPRAVVGLPKKIRRMRATCGFYLVFDLSSPTPLAAGSGLLD